MADELVFFTGFAPPRVTGQGDWTTVASAGSPAPTWDTGVTRKTDHLGSLRMTKSATGNEYQLRKTITAITERKAQIQLWVRLSHLMASGSGTQIPVVQLGNTAAGSHAEIQIYNHSGTTKFRCGIWDGVSVFGGTQIGPAISVDTWYRLDIQLDSSTGTHKLDWRVNGTAQTQGTISKAASDIDKIHAGMAGAGYLSSSGYIFQTDMTVIKDPSGWMDERTVLVFLPTTVETHNLDASPSSHFFTDAAALTTSETDSYQRLDDLPQTGSSDYVYVTGAPTATLYAEYGFGNSLFSKVPLAVRVCELVQQATAGGSVYTSRIVDGASTSDVQTALDINSATEKAYSKMFTTRPAGGSWTVGAFNALKYRFGLTADASPAVQMRAVLAEVLFSDTNVTAHTAVADLGLTGAIDTIATRFKRIAADLAMTVGITAAAVKTAKASAVLGLTTGIVSVAVKTAKAAADLGLTANIAVALNTTVRISNSLDLTAGIAVSAKKTTFASAALGLVVGVVAAARTTVPYAASLDPVTGEQSLTNAAVSSGSLSVAAAAVRTLTLVAVEEIQS